MNQRNISSIELDQVQMFAAEKFGYIDDQNKWLKAISDFVQTYINGGRFVVYNERNQYLDDFEDIDDALFYIEWNNENNEMWHIECEILK